MNKIIIIAGMLSIWVQLYADGRVYKWSDDAGRVNYSENPPLGVDAEKLEAKYPADSFDVDALPNSDAEAGADKEPGSFSGPEQGDADSPRSRELAQIKKKL